jgi:hypothetical protein
MRRSSSDPDIASEADAPVQRAALLPLPPLKIKTAHYGVRCGGFDLSLEEVAPLSVVWESGAVISEYVQDESVFPRGVFTGKKVLCV